MSDVYFDEENKKIRYNFQNNFKPKGMAGLLIKWGIVNDEKTAQILLLVIAIIFMATSVFITFNFLLPQSNSVPSSNQNTQNPLKDKIERNRLKQ